MSNASTEFEQAISTLITALESHEQFPEQRQLQKGKIYFVWDFVNSTSRMFQAARTGNLSAAEKKELKNDVLSRMMFTDILINDTTGKLSLMTGGDQTTFNDTIINASSASQQKAGDWGIAEGIYSS